MRVEGVTAKTRDMSMKLPVKRNVEAAAQRLLHVQEMSPKCQVDRIMGALTLKRGQFDTQVILA